MKAKNKIITAVLLSAGAAVGTALINKYIKNVCRCKKSSYPAGTPLLSLEARQYLLYKSRNRKAASSRPRPDARVQQLRVGFPDPALKRLLHGLHHRPFRLWPFRKAKPYLHEFSLCAAVK